MTTRPWGRDLGGLVTGDGQSIKRFALVRSAAPHTLTPAGWEQLFDGGIRTLIDLRHDREVSSAPIPDSALPASVSRVVVALEPPGYIEVWTGRDDQRAREHRQLTAAHHGP